MKKSILLTISLTISLSAAAKCPTEDVFIINVDHTHNYIYIQSLHNNPLIHPAPNHKSEFT